jgi:hypothetical protein
MRDLWPVTTKEMFEPTVDELIACVDREVKKRRWVYPRQVLAGKMSVSKADREIAMMEKVMILLRGIRGNRPRAA